MSIGTKHQQNRRKYFTPVFIFQPISPKAWGRSSHVQHIRLVNKYTQERVVQSITGCQQPHQDNARRSFAAIGYPQPRTFSTLVKIGWHESTLRNTWMTISTQFHLYAKFVVAGSQIQDFQSTTRSSSTRRSPTHINNEDLPHSTRFSTTENFQHSTRFSTRRSPTVNKIFNQKISNNQQDFQPEDLQRLLVGSSWFHS